MSASAIVRDIDAVCFDCWATLLVEVDGPVVHERRVEHVRACATAHGSPASAEAARAALDRAWQQHWDRWMRGERNDAGDIARAALRALGVDAAAAEAELVGRLDATVRAGEVQALPGARRTLESLAQAGFRLALVCDTGFTSASGVRRLLDSAGLLEWLDAHAFSDEAGVPKPHPKIFESALSTLGVEPRRALHVGDLRRTDVAGARALGMRTVRIRWAHDDASEHPDADAVVDSHAELRELFGLPAEQ